MTATPKKLNPKPVRKTDDSQSRTVVITKQRDFTHKEPIIIPSHLEEVPVISAASYIKDARNRWYIHTVEVKEVWDVHVNLFNQVKPHALKAHDYVVKRYQELTND
jgi:ribosomal protein S10